MNSEIQSLIDSLRLGQYEDPAEKISLLSAALQEHNTDLPLLLKLLRAPQIPLRLAAIDASKDRQEPELFPELFALAKDPELRIRVKVAEVLRSNSSKAFVRTLMELLNDSESDVRTAALKSTVGRSEFRAIQEDRLKNDSDWNVRLAAANALDSQTTPQVAHALFNAIQDDDADINRRCAEMLEKRLNTLPEATQKHLPADIGVISKVAKQVKYLGGHRFPKLMEWLTSHTTMSADPETLAQFGTDLTLLAATGGLPRGYHLEEALEQLMKLVQREPWRSIVVLGPPGVGKTALIHELVYELAKPENGGWHVLRVSPTDFMAGTKYLGEWETKVRNIIESVRSPRRVLLYVPNISDLSSMGTWSKSDANVATALAPYLDDGSIILIGESTAEEYEKGFGRLSSLRRLVDPVLLPASSVEQTRQVLKAIRDREGSQISDGLLNDVLELGNQFLGHISMPGNAAELLRGVIKIEKQSGQLLTSRDILNCLSTSTGIPSDLLDDAIPLDSRQIRDAFEKKIVGQTAAVEAVVDVVTLIKAGVTDPNKPFGVFLFVGPTGVGKTELARVLAEFIFGDVTRLKRFDMSEFSSPEGYTRLIGSNFENGLLTDAVRQHPFSVVLLDEIEKANASVFDLCLQIFDAGRLTDGRGRTVDFRRTIVILTSNIGARAALPPAGFLSAEAAAPAEMDKDRTFRELSRFFRPEFLNRLDQIVQFQPLSLQVAEQIARREIDLVLNRSGIKRRQLVVEVDPAVISLLVKEGYSPYFGARPLKRTVERLVLLPLARAISSGAMRERTILRLSEKNGQVQAVISRSEARGAATAKVPTLGQSLATRLNEMQARYSEMESSLRVLADRKAELITQTHTKDFFQSSDLKMAAFTEIHSLDEFLNLHQDVGKAIARIARNPSKEGLDTLAMDLEYLSFVATSRDARELGDCIVSVSLIDRIGPAQDGAEKLFGMYEGVAARRRMSVEVLGEFYNAREDRIYFLLAGLGAYRLMVQESGLHQLERRHKERQSRTGRETIREDRELLRVEVLSSTGKLPKPFRREVKPKISHLRPAKNRLIKASLSVALFHEPSVRSIEFWTAGPQDEALERALSVLYAYAQLEPGAHADNGIVRHYDVGMAAKVKDTRSGRTTTRVKQVFSGDLGMFVD